MHFIQDFIKHRRYFSSINTHHNQLQIVQDRVKSEITRKQNVAIELNSFWLILTDCKYSLKRLEFRGRGQNSNENAAVATTTATTSASNRHAHSNGNDNHNDTPIKVFSSNSTFLL